MRILYVTTIGGTMSFFQSFITNLVNLGHSVDIACNESLSKVPDLYYELGCKIHHVSYTRSPLKATTLKAIKELKKIVTDNQYDIVHCHTPIAAACTRIACKRARKNGTKVVYTAHGFHFYKGAPLKNWLIFYPIEKICAKWTDLLITINNEDYIFAQKKFKTKKIEYVPGVGINISKFSDTNINKNEKLKEIGIPVGSFVFLSVGELNKNKNHEIVIRAIQKIQDPNIHYIIAGKGALKEHLLNLAKTLCIQNQIHILGYRKDVNELYKASDCLIHPSFREGLPVSIMEAMASGLPCIASQIRGASDLIDSKGGILCPPDDLESFVNAMKLLIVNSKEYGQHNQKKALALDSKIIDSTMLELYNKTKGSQP